MGGLGPDLDIVSYGAASVFGDSLYLGTGYQLRLSAAVHLLDLYIPGTLYLFELYTIGLGILHPGPASLPGLHFHGFKNVLGIYVNQHVARSGYIHGVL